MGATARAWLGAMMLTEEADQTDRPCLVVSVHTHRTFRAQAKDRAQAKTRASFSKARLAGDLGDSGRSRHRAEPSREALNRDVGELAKDTARAAHEPNAEYDPS